MPDQPADAVPAATPTLAVAGVQMVSATDPAANRAAAAGLIARAAEGGARVVVLPEYFCLLGRRDTDKVELREAAGAGPLQDFLAEQAARHGIWLIVRSPATTRSICSASSAAPSASTSRPPSRPVARRW